MKALRLRDRNHRARPGQEVVYPESDGKPMETDTHRKLMYYLIAALKLWYASNRRVYVSGNNGFYFHEGDARKRVSPDVYVVKGIAAVERRVYKLWEEKKAPCASTSRGA